MPIAFCLPVLLLALLHKCTPKCELSVSVSRLFTKVMLDFRAAPRIPGNGLCYFILGQCRLMTGSKADRGQLAQPFNP